MNPVSGGSPPRDISMIAKRSIIIGVFVIIEFMVFDVFVFVNIIIKKIGAINTEYRKKYVIEWIGFSTYINDIIQPI